MESRAPRARTRDQQDLSGQCIGGLPHLKSINCFFEKTILNMYTVYMYTCMYVMLYYGMYVCVYLCMYGCICVCMYVCMYACMHVCAYVHIILYAHNPHQDLPFYPAFLYFMDSLQCEPSAICHLLHTKENSKSKPILELRVPQKQIKHNNEFDDLPPLSQPQNSSPKPLVLYTQIPTLSSEPSPQIHSIQ